MTLMMPVYKIHQTCLIRLLTVGMLVCGLNRVIWSAENVWSVQKLNENKPWDRFIDSPLPTRIEGRVSIAGGGLIRLTHCDLKIKADTAKLKTVSSKDHIEIKGHFKRDGSKVEFDVEDLRVMPNYLDQFEFQAAKLKRPTSEDWIQLGDWIGERGKFYEDPDLLKKANDAYMNSIDVEYRALKPTDAEGRFRLARKVDDLKLTPRRRMELIHEGLRIEWQTLQKGDPPDVAAWKTFADQLPDRLAGADQPIKKIVPGTKEAYDQDPIAVYRKATDEARGELHRWFFVAVTRRRLLNEASIDGRDGNSIADQIDKLIPEEAALAEKQRAASLPYRLANIGVANRAEAESLAEAYRARKQNENAVLALTQWIKSHEAQRKNDGVVGLALLADEYLTLLKNEPVAVEYLLEAYKLDPTFEEVNKKLTSLGYRLDNGKWSKSLTVRPNPSNAAVPATTGLAVGQTAAGLRAQLGQPTSLTRAITARGTTEVWCFGPPGSSRLVVRLERKNAEQELKVAAFTY